MMILMEFVNDKQIDNIEISSTLDKLQLDTETCIDGRIQCK